MRLSIIEIGTVYGKLTVTKMYRGEKFWMVEVVCQCGTVKQVSKSNFASGKTSTCGCGPRGTPFPKEHGLSTTLSYNSWKKMMQRCYDPMNQDFSHYGGRGIKVCQRWHSVTNFVKDMGERMRGFSIERVDVNADYSPDNCLWLPHEFQAKNRTDWRHTDEGKRLISESRKRDWKNGVYASKVAAQRAGK